MRTRPQLLGVMFTDRRKWRHRENTLRKQQIQRQ
ncbi:hypothetical protein LEMLEM_LOCUS7110 [Lemmus lemmus]